MSRCTEQLGFFPLQHKHVSCLAPTNMMATVSGSFGKWETIKVLKWLDPSFSSSSVSRLMKFMICSKSSLSWLLILWLSDSNMNLLKTLIMGSPF